jgi:hypothetical protein
VDASTVVAVASGVLVPSMLAGAAALWKLATMLAEVRSTTQKELGHNGGSSLKDYARDAALSSARAEAAAQLAREVAAGADERVRLTAAEQHAFQAASTARDEQKLVRLEHLQRDLTNVGTSLAVHVYEAQRAQEVYRQATGHDLPTFSTPEGSPLPNGADAVPRRRINDALTKEGTQ